MRYSDKPPLKKRKPPCQQTPLESNLLNFCDGCVTMSNGECVQIQSSRHAHIQRCVFSFFFFGQDTNAKLRRRSAQPNDDRSYYRGFVAQAIANHAIARQTRRFASQTRTEKANREPTVNRLCFCNRICICRVSDCERR